MIPPTSNKRPRGEREAIVLRRQRVFDFRLAGASYAQIAKQVGQKMGTVRNDLRVVLTDLAKHTVADAEQLRALELDRLDMAALAIVAEVRAGNLQAIDRWVRISESRRRLLGLDRQPALIAEANSSIQILVRDLPEPSNAPSDRPTGSPTKMLPLAECGVDTGNESENQTDDVDAVAQAEPVLPQQAT